jgi:hypothetical protein
LRHDASIAPIAGDGRLVPPKSVTATGADRGAGAVYEDDPYRR